MTDRIAPIRDLRFEGMDIPQLLEWIEQIKRKGRGSESMHTAVDGLRSAVQVVVDLDNTLRTELGKLQIAWEGNAGSLAQEATQHQTAVMQQSQDPLLASASHVTAQGEGYDSAKHSLPNPAELQHQQSENALEWAGGGFGYESDYDAEAKQIEAQKQAAQAALGSYRDTTVTQAEAYQPLPEMRPAPVSAQGVSPGSTPDVGASGSSLNGGATGGDASGGGTAGGDSGAGHSGGGDTGRDGGGRSGVGGRTDGGSPGKPGDPEAPPQGEGLGAGSILGIGAGGAAVAGLGALAAGRMLGGAKSGGKGGAGGRVRGGASAGEGKAGALGRGGTSGVGGGPGDTTAGRTASGAATSKPGAGSLMGPAATRGGPVSAEDEEHENKYFVEETPFDDNRLVAPAVFGDPEPEEQAAPVEDDESKRE